MNDAILTNKAGIWKSDDEWNLKSLDPIVYVENTSKQRVLQYSNYFDKHVILKSFDQNETNQRWKRKEASDDDYFKLFNPPDFKETIIYQSKLYAVKKGKEKHLSLVTVDKP